MGLVVLETAVVRPTHWPLSHGARRLADRAVTDCLGRAGHATTAVDMLINAGVYRERGLGEPALAAIIQDDADLNHEDAGHGTFSFDISNGMCGALTALDLLRGFLTSGAIQLGLVVASDSGPSPLHAHDLPRPEAGAALLAGFDGTVEGLSRVQLSTYPEYAGMLEGFWEWRDRRTAMPSRHSGTNRLCVRERSGFASRAVDCADESVTAFLAESDVTPAQVDLLVAAPEPGFVDPLADRLGIDHSRVLHVGELLGAMHTAQPIAAIDAARRSRRWSQAHTILIVSAGSGITVGCALYQH